VITLGYLTAKIAGHYLGVWSWIPLTLVIWVSMATITIWATTKSTFNNWLKPPKGKWGYSLLALLIGFLPLPLLLFHWQLLLPTEIWVSWLIFALVNPFIEESYWRGLLMGAASKWKPWQMIGYTSFFFAASHPIIWGVNSVANATPEVFISTLIMGVVWGIVYHKTQSLKWVIISHILVDLFNLSIPIFLNLYTPPI